MTPDDTLQDDRVIACLAALPSPSPSPELSAKIRAAALARLCPRPLHPAWALVVACSALGYLGSALAFTLGLF
jgi:hypothetical protein